MPPGCGHAVDLLHAFLPKTLNIAWRHIAVGKYVDDMVLVAQGPHFAGNLRHGYRQVHRSLTQANMKVNLKKTVVVCNGAKAKRLLTKVWKAAFKQYMNRARSLGLPATSKARIVKPLHS
eukprot:770590-Amphidinium_carterae.1